MAFNLDTLEEDLRDLLIRSCELADKHRRLALGHGARFSWNEVVFNPAEFPMLSPVCDDGIVTWMNRDGGGDMMIMEVPLDVLKGERGVEEWATETVDLYRKEKTTDMAAREAAERLTLASLIEKYGVPQS